MSEEGKRGTTKKTMRQQQRDNQMTMTWNKQRKEDTCHVELL